jgi:NitT/TauT family transport system substrate-binding protein
LLAIAPAIAAAAETNEVRVVKQIGLGFLPIMVMEHEKLIEKHARAAGLGEVKGTYATTVGPAVMNDAMLAGRIDIGANGPTSIILIWSRTKGTDNEIKGMAAMITSPMWLNTSKPNIKTVRDISPEDRIAVPGIKTSNQAIVLQMATAQALGKDQFDKFTPQTVAMSHFDGMAALFSKKEITLHLTSPPVQYLEVEQPGIHKVLSSDDVLGGPATFSNIFSSSKFRNANPRTVQGVARGVYRGGRAHQQGQEVGGAGLSQRVGGQKEHGRRYPEAARRRQYPVHDDAQERAEVRRVHVRRRLYQDQAGLVEGFVLSRDSRSPGQLTWRWRC